MDEECQFACGSGECFPSAKRIKINKITLLKLSTLLIKCGKKWSLLYEEKWPIQAIWLCQIKSNREWNNNEAFRLECIA